MRRITLIKQYKDASPYTMQVFGRLFTRSFVFAMRKQNLFSGSDYFFYYNPLDAKTCRFDVIYITDRSQSSPTPQDITIALDQKDVERSIHEVSLEVGKDLDLSTQAVTAAVKSISKTPWINFEAFQLYTGNDDLGKSALHEANDTPIYKRLLAFRLKESYIHNHKFAPLLFWLVAEPLFMETLYALKEEYPIIIQQSKNLYEEKHILRIAEGRVYGNESLNTLLEHAVANFQKIDSERFVQSIIQYINEDFYNLPIGSMPATTLFRDTHTIAGIETWRFFVTSQNIEEMLNAMTFHVGDYENDLMTRESIGSYLKL